MPVDVVVLVATAVLAVVAVVAAVVAVRAARRIASTSARRTGADVGAVGGPDGEVPPGDPVPAAGPSTALVVLDEPTPAAPEARLVEGRVVRPPTQHQVVTAALGRPQVRATVLVRGVAHALRPESRDRIAGLVRREYRQRRRERLRAGRRAARAAGPSGPPAASDQWLGET